MNCSLPYIESASISETEKSRLTGIHMSILEEVKSSKSFKKENGKYVTLKNEYPKATQFIQRVNDAYQQIVATLPSIGAGKHSLNVNVTPLIEEKDGELFFNVDTPQVQYTLKSIQILQSPKADEIFRKGDKNNWTIDKILQELQVPKEQQELIKSFNTRNREEILTSLLANYSYTVEVNVAKDRVGSTIHGKASEPKLITDEGGATATGGNIGQYFVDFINNDGDPDVRIFDSYEQAKRAVDTEQGLANSKVYSNLTVPGGTNYTENEIATPAITPSIKGHAQFSTDSGIGWFRSDDRLAEDTKTDNIDGTITDYTGYNVNKIPSGYTIYNKNRGWLRDATGKPLDFKTEKEASDYLNKLINQGITNNSSIISKNDKIIFGHPTIGKSYLKQKGNNDFITLDDDYADEVNAFIDANKGTETRQEYKGRKPKEYNEFMLNLFDRLKVQAKKEGKRLFVSNTNILKERMSEFDKVITIPKDEFKKRFDARGATYGFEDWKSDIDITVAKVDKSKVISTTGYLSDLLEGNPKTRRILEVQSDLFQKGRDKTRLIGGENRIPEGGGGNYIDYQGYRYVHDTEDISFRKVKISDIDRDGKNWRDITEEEYKTVVKNGEVLTDKEVIQNQFLQLLNKDNNWVSFFVKSIIQDSAKKGYEKVLFPSGNTASKVEGHTTLEEFKKQKEDRIKELEKDIYDYTYNNYRVYRKSDNISLGNTASKEDTELLFNSNNLIQKNPSDFEIRRNDESYIIKQKNNEINQLKQELERVEKEGFGALKPIYNFYENTVTNLLKKNYNVKKITDEYGNTWNEIELTADVRNQAILLQKQGTKQSVASEDTIKMVKEAAKKMGIDLQELSKYAASTGLDVKGVNGVADLTKGIIAVAQGKEGVALTEEMVHIATAILEHTTPSLVTEMISKIGRFKIYKETLEAYRDNKNYQLPNGKPDIRKIKKEAVDKLIAEVIINKNENKEQFPELTEEINQSLVRKWWNTVLDWFKGQYKKANINIFEEVAQKVIEGAVGGTVKDIKEKGVYLQISDKQQEVQKKILETKQNLRKVESTEKADPLLLDSEEASNYYEVKSAEGTWEKVKKRVTDRVKAWYKQKFGGKVFTEEEKKFNELKRETGIQGHADLEEIHSRYFNSDGTRKETPGERPIKNNIGDQDLYDKLEKYYVDLINQPEFKDALIFSEVLIYDPKEKEAGTIDFLAVDKNGKANILDWKFMHVSGDDVAWFKQGAFNIQIGTYSNILKQNYGIKEFGKKRAIPFVMSFKHEVKNDKSSPLLLSGIAVGSADSSKIEDIKLVPISEQSESTGFEALDNLLKQLNKLLNQLGSEKVSDEQEREFKIERLNTLRRAIKYAQGTLDMTHLVDYIDLMKVEGEQILEDYNTIYKNRPPRSGDSKNEELSDFSDKMNVYMQTASIFSNVYREVGKLIYTEDMLKNAKNENEEKLALERKEALQKLKEQSDSIDESLREIKSAALKFADKHIGERNLVAGLLNPEKVIKGLSSVFRGVSELPLRSLEILSKLTSNAQLKAAEDALTQVQTLMKIRENLVKKGGNIRDMISKIYQKDSKDKFVNKIINKYSEEFRKIVDEKAEKGGDLQWLNDNIDIKAYKEEANKILEERIKRVNDRKHTYKGSEEEREYQASKEIEKLKTQWDIDNKNFIGWNNYVIKRHPLPKWYSKQYLEIKNDSDLLELYDFIVRFNEKAKDIGYIDNQVTKNFLPFIRKSMAEELVWNNRLSVMDNFYKSLQMNPDDTGYGKFNELSGQLENSIPKYYTVDFTVKDENGERDYTQVSEDLFKNMILYIQQVEKYKYLSEVEGQLKLIKTVETFKTHLNTNRSNKVVKDENGNPQEIPGNEDNVKIFDDFLRVMVYDQKYVLSDADTPLGINKAVSAVKKAVNQVAGKEVWKEDENATPTSLIKTMDAVNRGFQLKTLGFEFISGAVNWFGANIQLATQSGNYFKAREFAKNEAKLIGQKFENKEEQEIFTQLVNTFMPLKDDPAYKLYKEAGLSKLTQGSLSDTLMVFIRQPEILVEKAIFLTLLENTMIVNGNIVSIREYVKSKYKDRNSSAIKYNETKEQIEKEIEELKKEKSIAVTRKLEDGKLVIPGLDLSNKEELQRLSQLTRRISSNATGGLTKENINRASMSIWTKSMMVFKNWIPKLVDTRFGEFRKVSDDFSVRIDENGVPEGQKYDIGRLRLLGYVLTFNFIKGANDLKNIIYLNDAGLQKLDEMFEEFRKEYKKETGEDLNIDKDQFIDLIRTNLRNQLKELAILAGLMGTMLSLGFMAPDDEDDKASKNFHRYSLKVVDKFVGELSFFYNPEQLKSLLTGGIFPAIGLVDDMSRFISHFWSETTGIDIGSGKSFDEVKKEAHPIKYAMRMFPVSKPLVTYLAIFSEDFAKEMNVTIQKENR